MNGHANTHKEAIGMCCETYMYMRNIYNDMFKVLFATLTA